jgi:hypothetical protein
VSLQKKEGVVKTWFYRYFLFIPRTKNKIIKPDLVVISKSLMIVSFRCENAREYVLYKVKPDLVFSKSPLFFREWVLLVKEW